LSHDPDRGVDCGQVAEHVKNDPRVAYVIWNRQIWTPSVARRWRPYTGANPHLSHMHVSIRPGSRGDTRPWFGDPDPVDPTPVDPDQPEPEEATVLYRYQNGTVVPLIPAPFVLVDLGAAVVGVAPTGALYVAGAGAPTVEAAIDRSGYRAAFVDRTVRGVPTWDGQVLTIVSHLDELYSIPIRWSADDAGIVARAALQREALLDIQRRAGEALA